MYVYWKKTLHLVIRLECNISAGAFVRQQQMKTKDQSADKILKDKYVNFNKKLAYYLEVCNLIAYRFEV